MLLRPYQSDLVARSAGADNVIIHAPTGAGKTVIQATLAEQESARGGWVLALSHRKHLRDSLAAAVGSHGESITIQAAARRITRPPTVILIDECHHAVSPTYRALLDAYPAARRIGLTATTVPGLSELFSRFESGPSTAELIAAGYLCRPRYVAPALPIDLSGVGVRAGEYDAAALLRAIERSRVAGDAIAAYRQHGAARPALIFCASIAHAEATAAEWRGAGISTAVITGSTPDDERRMLIADLAAGRVAAIASVGVLFEGVDVPAAAVAVLLRPTLSSVVHLQSLGRVLRTRPGKADALIIDCAGNLMRHGTAELDRAWTIDGLAGDSDPTRKTADGQLLSIRQCQHCLAIHETGPDCCPSCGTTYARERRVSAAVQARLDELAAEEIERARRAAARARKNEEATCRTLADWQALGRRRGHHVGWAFHRFKARASRP